MENGAGAAVVFDECDFAAVGGDDGRSRDGAGRCCASGVEIRVVGPVDGGCSGAAESGSGRSGIKLVVGDDAGLAAARAGEVCGEDDEVFGAIGSGGGVERKFGGVDGEPCGAVDGDASRTSCTERGAPVSLKGDCALGPVPGSAAKAEGIAGPVGARAVVGGISKAASLDCFAVVEGCA